MNKQIFDAEFLNFAEDVAAKWQILVSGAHFPVELFSQDKTYRLTIQGEIDHRWNGGFRVSKDTGRIEVAYEYLKSNEAYTGNFIFYQICWGRAMYVLNNEQEADEAATKLYCSLHKPVKEMIRGIAAAYTTNPAHNKPRIEKIIALLEQIIPDFSSRHTLPKKYIKKPVTVEAIQYNNLNREEVEKFVGKKLHTELESETAYVAGQRPPIFSLSIETKEGIMKAFPGDWIIKEPFPTGDRDFYPCKKNIFEQTYEEISSTK